MSVRSIREIVTGNVQYDGAGVKLLRVISLPNVKEFDPFLMLDSFNTRDPDDYVKGFPWHPHRGIETVTYLIHGEIEHKDSLGNKGKILDGCCQWMTAGSGILHQEMPRPSESTQPEEQESVYEASDWMLGVQLWINLPQKNKMAPPKYHDITADKVPWVCREGAAIGVISGHYENTTGVMQGDYVKTLFLDVELDPGVRWELETEQDATLFVFIVEGEGWFGEADHQLVSNKKAVLFHQGEEFVAKASQHGLHFLLFSGHPLQEPIAWGGPIVMNTDEELLQAFKELRHGTFIREKQAGTA